MTHQKKGSPELQAMARESLTYGTPMTLTELIADLRRSSKEIANYGYTGWGNVCTSAADTLEANVRLKEAALLALDALETELSLGPLIKQCHDAIAALKEALK